jgi:hypothetical protein
VLTCGAHCTYFLVHAGDCVWAQEHLWRDGESKGHSLQEAGSSHLRPSPNPQCCHEGSPHILFARYRDDENCSIRIAFIKCFDAVGRTWPWSSCMSLFVSVPPVEILSRSFLATLGLLVHLEQPKQLLADRHGVHIQASRVRLPAKGRT